MARPREQRRGCRAGDAIADDADSIAAGHQREPLRSLMYSRIHAGLSCQVRAVTRLPLTTTSRSRYVPPKLSMSNLHLATAVASRPLRTPAAATISMP